IEAEVALTGVTQEGDDALARAELPGHLEGDEDVRSRAEPHEHAFFAPEGSLRLVSVPVRHRAHLVDDARVVVLGHEAGRQALDLRRAALSPRDGRAGVRLDRDDAALGVLLL